MRSSQLYTFLCILLLFGTTVMAQSASHGSDSLMNAEYADLKAKYLRFFDSLPALSSTYAKAYISKAKLEGDSIELSNGYSLMTYSKDREVAISYLDSLIPLLLISDDKEKLARSYYQKGGILFKKRNFKDALDNYLKAKDLSALIEDERLKYLIEYSIGTLKKRLSNFTEAKEIFLDCNNYLETKDYYGNYRFFYLSNLQSLSDCYRSLGDIDSSSILNRKGYKHAAAVGAVKNRAHFTVDEGINEFSAGDTQAAIDSINKGVVFFEETNGNPNLIVSYYYLGRAHERLGNEQTAIDNYHKVDSLFRLINDLKPETRDTYDRLINYYKKTGDKKKQLEVVGQLLKVDSVLNSNYRYLNTNIIKQYDTPQLLLEKENLISELNKGNKSISRWLYVLAGLLVIAIVAISYYVRLQQKYRKRFEELLATNKKNARSAKSESVQDSITPAKKSELSDIGISEELIKEIQQKLADFEKTNGYLENSTTLNSLSKKLNTNSKYLSKVINYYEQKNFSSYINDLRIDHTIDRLKNDRIFRSYAIKAIADEVGFNNTESFSKAFYKNTGIYPSFFIKELQKKLSNK
ncbi:helix-turn-helix domain-containing protein [Flavobacteriaceae bacterium M23B6Z8]